MPDAVRRAFASLFPSDRRRIQNPARRKAVGLYDAAKAAVQGLPQDWENAKEAWRVQGADLVRQRQGQPPVAGIRGMTPAESFNMAMAHAVDPRSPAMDRLALADLVLPGMTRWKQGTRLFHGTSLSSEGREAAKPFKYFTENLKGMGAGGDFKGAGIYLTEDPHIGTGYMREHASWGRKPYMRTHNLPPQAKIFDSINDRVRMPLWKKLRKGFEEALLPSDEVLADLRNVDEYEDMMGFDFAGINVKEEIQDVLQSIEDEVAFLSKSKVHKGAKLDDVMTLLESLYEDVWGPPGPYVDERKAVWNLLHDYGGYDGLKYQAGTYAGLSKKVKKPVNYVIYNYDVINDPSKLMSRLPKSGRK